MKNFGADVHGPGPGLHGLGPDVHGIGPGLHGLGPGLHGLGAGVRVLELGMTGSGYHTALQRFRTREVWKNAVWPALSFHLLPASEIHQR